MPAARFPPDEERRLAALRALEILDTAPDAALDAVTAAAAAVCGVPISLISLVDEHRQWFKSNIGLAGVTETPRALAFCAHAILDDGMLEVENAMQDARFADNPLVAGAPHIPTYAGVPLVLSGGSRIGTLCMIDRQPMKLDDRQRQIVTQLARAASHALEQWRTSRIQNEAEQRLRESEEFLERTGQLAQVGGWGLDLRTGKLTWTAETYRIHGLDPSHQPDMGAALAFYPPEGRAMLDSAMARARQTGAPYDLELPFIRADGRRIWVRALGEGTMQDGAAVRLAGAFQDITERVERAEALRDAQERATLATEAGQIGIWDWNLVNGVKIWSKLTFQLYGVTSGEAPATLES